MGERGKEVLIHRVAFAVDAVLFVHLGSEAGALLVRVGQLAEAVRQFDAAGVQLEPLGHAGIVGGAAGQRGSGAG